MFLITPGNRIQAQLATLTPGEKAQPDQPCSGVGRCLMIAMKALKPRLEINRQLELWLWCEATTIFVTEGHREIYNHDGAEKEGVHRTLGAAAALKASNLTGTGLYSADDNILGELLYDSIMAEFLVQIETSKQG